MELVHIDLWGPYKTKTYSGCNQFVTVVDDFNRYTWVYLVKYEPETSTILENFVNYAEKQFDSKVLCIRSDNALELCKGKFKLFCQQKGIVQQTTCSYTPQQNGVVQRKHKHLLDTARALLFQSKVPDKYWGEYVLCASYLINRMLLVSINNSTPYSILYKEAPNLSILKPFGFICFVATTKAHKIKIDPKASTCVFLGYPVNQKGFKVLNLSTLEIFVSRAIKFYELHFPFHIISFDQIILYNSVIFLPKCNPKS